MTNVAVGDDKFVARPLAMLAELIQKDLEQGASAAANAGMPYYRSAGEKMLEAKGQMTDPREFKPWLAGNLKISGTHARRCMDLVVEERHRDRPFTSMGEFMRKRKKGRDPSFGRAVRRRAWHEDVKEAISRAKEEANAAREAEKSAKREREAEKQLGLRVIEIGFKVLAKELHPDVGGSREAMTRLNYVRDRLKQHA